MWAWFSNWLRRRRARRRALFIYWNGAEWRYGDPAILWRKLFARPDVNVESILPLADAGHEPEASTLHDHLVDVFELEPYDSATARGLTAWEVHEVLNAFSACVRTLKKKFNRGWMPWQLWALEQSTNPAAPAGAPKSAPDCGSPSTPSGSSASTTAPEPSAPG